MPTDTSHTFVLKVASGAEPETCESDFESDGDVDGADLSIFQTDFGRTNCQSDCAGDFDQDNDVDGTDLAIFSGDIGRTDCP